MLPEGSRKLAFAVRAQRSTSGSEDTDSDRDDWTAASRSCLSVAGSSGPLRTSFSRDDGSELGLESQQPEPAKLGLRARYFGPEEEGGERHGFGVLAWEDGRRYEGEFELGLLQGHASMTWPDGRMYNGQYVQNKKHGVGVFSWPDGRRYSGQWVEGRREGRGVYTNARGETLYGQWAEDKPVQWESIPEKTQATIRRQIARVGGA